MVVLILSILCVRFIDVCKLPRVTLYIFSMEFVLYKRNNLENRMSSIMINFVTLKYNKSKK